MHILPSTRTIIGRQQHMHFFVFCRFATAAMGMPNLKTKEAGVVRYKTEKKTNQSEHNNNKKSTTAPLPTNNHFNKQPLSTNNHFQESTTPNNLRIQTSLRSIATSFATWRFHAVNGSQWRCFECF